MSESVSGHKRKGEGKEAEEAKRVKGLDEEEEEKAPQEEGGVLKSYPPEDLCNVTVETDKGWKIKCHQADLFRFPNSQVFRTMFDKDTATISVPSSYFLDAKEFVEFFDDILSEASRDRHPSWVESKTWPWKDRRLCQLNFFGLDTELRKMLWDIRYRDVLTAEQFFQIGRTYNSDDFLSKAAYHFVHTLPCDEEKALAASVHLGPHLLRLARNATRSNVTHSETNHKIRREIKVFTDSITSRGECDDDDCPRSCTGDSYEHPRPDHFVDTDDGDYEGDAFTALGKIHALVKLE
jgi:hypothetical protein